ncbi:MAG: hydroxylase [Burkholderiales bacterium PBB3]|nr:MAG: hydroxylase [Burkholderiales bacterium PBB3]
MKTQYLEIVTSEVEAVCATYATTFGIKFGASVPALGGARTAPMGDGSLIGVRAPLRTSEAPVVRPYWLVQDIVSAVSAAQSAGALLALPPMPIEGYGTCAILQQGGNDHGLWQL